MESTLWQMKTVDTVSGKLCSAGIWTTLPTCSSTTATVSLFSYTLKNIQAYKGMNHHITKDFFTTLQERCGRLHLYSSP